MTFTTTVARTHGLVLPLDSGADLRLNLDGLVAESDSSYAILFRSGTLESASAGIVNGDRIASRILTEHLVQGLDRYMKLCGLVKIAPPIAVFATLSDIHNVQLAVRPDEWHSHEAPVFDRSVVSVPEVLIESLDVQPSKIARPLLDALWQAAGLEYCSHFDSDGNLKPRR